MTTDADTTSPTWQGHGCGKLILFGEHAVVWGAPAIAAGLTSGAHATLQTADHTEVVVRLDGADDPLFRAVPSPDSERPIERAMARLLDAFGVTRALRADVTLAIPPGAGLGSSAALAVAVCRALASMTGASEEVVARAVSASEGVFHGNASGIDQTAAMQGGLFRFWRDDGGMHTRRLTAPPLTVAVCEAAPGASTARMVRGVGERRERHPTSFAHLTRVIEEIVDGAQDALASGDTRQLGELADLNHGVLASFGVTTDTLDRACHLARAAGATGAKLTGAGGGGCVLAFGQDIPAILSAWRAHDLSCFSTKILPHTD